MQELNLSDLKCPLPVLHTQKALKKMKIGSKLAVITTDPMAAIDLPHLCNQQGYQLLETQNISNTTLRFVIEKKS